MPNVVHYNPTELSDLFMNQIMYMRIYMELRREE
jgi:hypothetical protein